MEINEDNGGMHGGAQFSHEEGRLAGGERSRGNDPKELPPALFWFCEKKRRLPQVGKRDFWSGTLLWNHGNGRQAARRGKDDEWVLPSYS